MGSVRRRLPLALVALLVLAACGRSGLPVAPERVTPLPAADVSVAVVDRVAEVAWTPPTRRADGARLRDLTLLRLFRSEDDGAGEPKPALADGRRVPGYTEVAVIAPGEPAPATFEGGRMVWVDRGPLTLGRRYTYVVLAEDGRGHVSPPSERASAWMIAAPVPPADVQTKPGEREVRLTWRPSATLIDGTPARSVVYEILRAPGPDAPLDIVTVTAAGATEFVDRGLENERPYVYVVRALRTFRGTLARSQDSARVTGTAVDMTPPRVPADLAAVPSQGTVRLVWSASPDADVGRYVVYRAREGAALERVGSVAAPGVTFTDRDVPAGRWRYAVTAQDTSSRANESARSAEVTVTVP
ncbi:MAG TPA: fibronectin type III domain-containing protein [Terriglobales bacterium]|nr:fibronectin type III domain-containing protein [Terriglobales bacterium]